ncbi:N-acetyl-gamma-glutamyl-phosphate reductase [Hahella sp. SMD15-11]|uniref:N-acetyl-gamma-glutamyl-phosphate reductase n=1 Tax=Thermohahella caldifontis TaxID=3142973 RepID=A0AB39UV21_9GAMM
MTQRIKAAIVGGTGYTGVELIRLLLAHPDVELTAVTSRTEAGQAVADMFPNLRGHTDLRFTTPDESELTEQNVVFFATPNGVAMKEAGALLAAGVRVIDLSADFRIRDVAEWERWYGQSHAAPELIGEAVYGLPEMYRDQLRGARLVANPGCYPTAVQLGFLPALESGLVDPAHLIADAKSGVSGAGRQGKVANLLAEVSESFKAYGASGHRHLPEIRQGLGKMTDRPVGLTFVPHLVPMIRGIEATLYAPFRGSLKDMQALYEKRFASEPFVDVMPPGSLPETRSVRGTNLCRVALHQQPGSDQLIVVSVIDNLVKGAAGQAVQNMNLMFDLPETAGLVSVPVLP